MAVVAYLLAYTTASVRWTTQGPFVSSSKEDMKAKQIASARAALEKKAGDAKTRMSDASSPDNDAPHWHAGMVLFKRRVMAGFSATKVCS